MRNEFYVTPVTIRAGGRERAMAQPKSDPASLLTLLIVVFLGGVYALLKVPALTSHVFSGTSGLSSGAVLEYLWS